MVLAEISGPKQKRFKTRWDIEDELGLDPSSIRDNEGEAALYGVYYDDTDYDYMQHMRDLGTSSDGRFIEGGYTQISSSRKGKAKQTLEDALKDACLDDVRSADHGNEDSMGSKALIELDILPPMSLKQTTYEHQQDVPDALAGFQPDMDPRLREVLEALEDEAYVDEEDETFAELARGREEISQGDFEWSARTYDDGSGASLDDGWETDDTTKPLKEHKSRSEETGDGDVVMADSPAEEGKGWEAEYGKFKTDKQKVKAKPVRPTHSSLSSSVVTGSSITDGRRKKRKGALTSSTSYSMTSSSLARTEGLTLLDDRFDQVVRLSLSFLLSVPFPPRVISLQNRWFCVLTYLTEYANQTADRENVRR